MVNCRSGGSDEGWHGVPAAAGPPDKSVLMQDLHSSHSEVALSWTAMMTTTQSAGLSTPAVGWRSEWVWVCDASVCTVANEWVRTSEMSVGGNTCFVYVGVQYCRCMHFCQRWKVTKYNHVLTYAQVLRCWGTQTSYFNTFMWGLSMLVTLQIQILCST